MTVAVTAQKTTIKPMIRPSLRSRVKGVRLRRNAASDSVAKQTLVVNEKVAAYCAFKI